MEILQLTTFKRFNEIFASFRTSILFRQQAAPKRDNIGRIDEFTDSIVSHGFFLRESSVTHFVIGLRSQLDFGSELQVQAMEHFWCVLTLMLGGYPQSSVSSTSTLTFLKERYSALQKLESSSLGNLSPEPSLLRERGVIHGRII